MTDDTFDFDGDSRPDVAPAAPKRAKKAAEPAGEPEEKRVKIILEEHESIPPTGQYVGVNGKGFQVMRGVEVTVPLSVVHVLENAVATRSITDDQGRVVGQQNYHAAPFRVIRYL